MNDRSPHPLHPKYAAEQYMLSADFTPALLPTDRLETVTTSIELVEGQDPAPELVVTDGPSWSRLLATQLVQGGVAGCTYRITITAQTFQGETHLIVADLPVI